jgi:cation diffusion facilitator CzcD-associated flavoprotein CzcO
MNEITTNHSTVGMNPQVQELDALIVGAGFSGVYQLKKLRDDGWKVKLVESGSDFGGVWYWNRYPGARVDSTIPHYEFSDPALWKNWNWKQHFPSSAELRGYFDHVARTWDLRKDTKFDSFVEVADWNDEEKKWTVKTKKGEVFKVKFLLLNTGFAAKRYIPDWKGIEKSKCESSSTVISHKLRHTNQYQAILSTPRTGLMKNPISLARRSLLSEQEAQASNSPLNLVRLQVNLPSSSELLTWLYI